MWMMGERSVVEALRRVLLGDYGMRLARLEEELADVRRRLREPVVAQAAVVEALEQAVATRPAEVAAALAPLAAGLQRPAKDIRGRRRAARGTWLSAAVVLLLGLVLAMQGKIWSQTPGAETRAAGGQAAKASAAAAGEAARPGTVPAWQPTVVLEERNDGFGMGQSPVSDKELAREVRSRLAKCDKLAGTYLSFSVKDGWVWLRGEASASGREAAGAALSDLGANVLVVNQIEVVRAADMLAER